MKNKRNTIVKTISKIVIVLAITCSTGLNAAVPQITLAGDDDNNVRDNRDADAIPLDGGLAILLAGAAAFGIKKLRDKKNS